MTTIRIWEVTFQGVGFMASNHRVEVIAPNAKEAMYIAIDKEGWRYKGTNLHNISNVTLKAEASA